MAIDHLSTPDCSPEHHPESLPQHSGQDSEERGSRNNPAAYRYTGSVHVRPTQVQGHWSNARSLGIAAAHISICHALLRNGNRYVVNVRDIAGEIESSISALNIPTEKIPARFNEYGVPVNPTRKIREELRNGEFERWTQMERAGGVHQFRVHTQSNKWVYNRCGLTNSEWISSLKMTVNGAPVRSLHGRSKDGPACRAPGCEAERETLSHVLGSCHEGSLLRNARHNKIRTVIAEAFRGKEGVEVYEEVPCIADKDSSRRVDIIFIDRGKSLAWIVDPTVRYETGDQQATEVDEEKRRIYGPCIRDLKEKHRMEEFEDEVIGLYVGARETISRFFVDFCTRFTLPKDLMNRVVISVLKGSCSILHNHLYSQQPMTAV